MSKSAPRLAIEAGSRDGEVNGMDSFGESAPAPVLYSHFGIAVENAIAKVKLFIVQ